MSDFVQLRHYAAILSRSWWVIVLVAALGGGIGYGISKIQPKVYTAYTTLVVGQSIDAANPDSKDFQVGEQLVQTYANLVRREPVLRGTVEKLNLSGTWQELRSRVQTRRVEGTQLLEVVVEADSPQEAQRTANEIARQLMLLGPAAHQLDAETSFVSDQLAGLRSKIEASQARIDKLQATLAALQMATPPSAQSSKEAQEIQHEIDTTESLIAEWQSNYTQIIGIRSRTKPSNNLTVIEPGQVDVAATRPKGLLNALVAGSVSMSLAVVYLLIRASLNTALRSVEDMSSLLGLVCCGSIGVVKGKRFQEKLITARKPFSGISEAYRILSGNLRPMLADRRTKTILVTSPVLGEGKTVTIANLAVVMAQSGLKTIVVDADLRRSRLHEIFEVSNERGLTDLIQSSEVKISDILQDTAVKNLQVITSGTLPANPSELLNLLSSLAMRQLLATLSEMADVILLDSSPILPVADTAVLSTIVDGVILVIQAGRTKQEAARQAISNLQQVDAKLLGGVLNQVSFRSGARYATAVTPRDRTLRSQIRLRAVFAKSDRWLSEPFAELLMRRSTNKYSKAHGSPDLALDRSEERGDIVVQEANVASVIVSSPSEDTVHIDDIVVQEANVPSVIVSSPSEDTVHIDDIVVQEANVPSVIVSSPNEDTTFLDHTLARSQNGRKPRRSSRSSRVDHST